jgi:hypothetical protein
LQRTSESDQKGEDILVVPLDGYGMGQGLERQVGALDAGGEEECSVAVEELVGAGAGNHGQLAREQGEGVGG